MARVERFPIPGGNGPSQVIGRFKCYEYAATPSSHLKENALNFADDLLMQILSFPQRREYKLSVKGVL
jgi:hypothetical protein